MSLRRQTEMAARIFVNYRRDDDAAAAARVRDGLAARFGNSSIFMDVDNLLAGQRFDEELAKALATCDVLIAVIGPRWLDLLRERAGSGVRDYVREEIAAALQRQLVIIPVRVGREGRLAPLPGTDELPDDIRELVLYQKHDVAHERFGRDIAELSAAITSLRRTRRQEPVAASVPWGWVLGSVAGALAVAWVGAHQLGVPVWWPFEVKRSVPALVPTNEDLAAAARAAVLADQRREAERQKTEEDERKRRAAVEAEAARKAAIEADARRKVEESERQRLAALQRAGVVAPTSEWLPNRAVTLIVPAGTGGSADQMARFIQGIASKHNLMRHPMIVVNKAGGAGAEGFLEAKKSSDPHVLVIATSNLFTTPLATGIAFDWRDLTPVAVPALDQFILWVHADAPYKSARQYIDAVKAGQDRAFKMGGTGSKQEDQIITAAFERLTAPKRFTYVPYAGGGTVAVQLAGKHVDSTLNNPIEAVSHWRTGVLRPLCLLDSQRSTYKAKIADRAWSDIPTCREAGVDVEYQMPRAFFLHGGARPEQVRFYVELLKQVTATPEWQKLMEDGALKPAFLTGQELRSGLEAAEQKHYALMKEAGFLAPGK